MSNRNNYYRRMTKATQKNLYKHLYNTESVKQQHRTKYLSYAGLTIPGAFLLASIYIKSKILFAISLIVWIICIAIVFINAFRKQKKFVINLKEAGMPRSEFIRVMKTQTKSQTQLNKYINLWDKV